MKKVLWNLCYGVLLLAFTVYVMLDTFVITRVYVVLPNDVPASSSVSSTQTNDSSSENDISSDDSSISSSDVTSNNSFASSSNNTIGDDVSSPNGTSNGTSSVGSTITSSANSTSNNTVTSSEASSDVTSTPSYTTSSTVSSSSNSSSEGSTSSVSSSNNSSSSNTPSGDTSSESQSDEPVVIITDNYYSDGNITITLTTYRENDTDIYVADVKISSAEYLKTAFAKNAYGRNLTEKTSVIAENNGAILAINGDYYGAQTKGYVLRNGVLYRSTADKNQEDLVIYGDGSFEIINESDVSANTLLERGAEQVFSFGPALITDGKISVGVNDEVGQSMASNPRTAIGIIDDLHYVFVVSDGRTKQSEGLSLYELAQFMQSLGAQTAYNLDGGGSATMVFNGKVINNPTTNGTTIKERSVSDIVYIGY